MQPQYYLKDEEFVIEDYNYAKPFSSFLPGIAGLKGRPLWAFYVNRGQCITSFGINSKEGAILEFYPANTAYRRTTLEGFRTFLKISGGKEDDFYEPFSINLSRDDSRPRQLLSISPHEFRIEDISAKHGLRCEALYYTVPQEDFAALARVLTIENTSSADKEISLFDGLPKISPYGMNEFFRIRDQMPFSPLAWRA